MKQKIIRLYEGINGLDIKMDMLVDQEYKFETMSDQFIAPEEFSSILRESLNVIINSKTWPLMVRYAKITQYKCPIGTTAIVTGWININKSDVKQWYYDSLKYLEREYKEIYEKFSIQEGMWESEDHVYLQIKKNGIFTEIMDEKHFIQKRDYIHFDESRIDEYILYGRDTRDRFIY